MQFLWYWALALWLLVPLFVLAYIKAQRRRQIAETTQAKYYRALDEQALSSIDRNLDVHLYERTEPEEITTVFSGLALVFLLLGGFLSYRFFGGLP